MRVWTYVIATNVGAAPNFEAPFTTLVVCKPRIRKHATAGDLVLAFNGKNENPDEPHSVCWAGVVSEVLPMGDYWNDQRFSGKKPSRSKTPDNFYRRSDNGRLVQVPNQTHTPDQVPRDVRGLIALVFQTSWYFGSTAAMLPEHFGLRMVAGRRGERRVDIDQGTWKTLERWLDQNEPNHVFMPLSSDAPARCKPRSASPRKRS